MARQIVTIHTEQRLEDMHQKLKKHLEQNGFRYKTIRGKEMLCRESLYATRYYEIFYRNGCLQIEGFLLHGNQEFAAGRGGLVRKQLKKELQAMGALFPQASVSCYSTNSSAAEINDGNGEFFPQQFVLRSNLKHLSMVSLAIGIFCILIPLPAVLMGACIILSIAYGVKGLPSTTKWISVIGLILAALNLGLTLLNLYYVAIGSVPSALIR